MVCGIFGGMGMLFLSSCDGVLMGFLDGRYLSFRNVYG